MATGGDVRSDLRAELERRLASLSPAKRALAARARSVAGRPEQVAGRIAPRTDRSSAPLSFSQELLWLLDRASPGMHAYNVPRTSRLRGVFDLVALQRALDAIVERHEVLRTTYEVVDGGARAIVGAPQPVPIARFDLRSVPPGEREAAATGLVRDLTRRPFDLARDVQLRATIVRLGDDDNVLVLESHHIASDAWSHNILLRELAKLYDGFRNGIPADLPPLPLQYGDFAAWQRENLQGQRLEGLLEYWRGRLGDAPAVVELPVDRPYPAAVSFEGAAHSVLLAPELLESLRALAREHNATLFMTLLAAFQVLLARYGGQSDVVVGSPIAGRANDEIDGIIGYFADTLVLRSSLGDDPSFVDLLARVRETCLGAYEHQDIPFEKLVLELQPKRVPGRAPLVQTMFTLLDAELAQLRLGGTTLVPFGSDRGATKFDLSLFAQERSNGLRAELQYRTDVFDASTIVRMLANFGALLEGIVAEPERAVSLLPVVSADERRLLADRNATAAPYPNAATLHELIFAQCARTPTAVAVECSDASGAVQRLTYAELGERARVLAAHLRSLGVGPGVGVGICVDRSLDLMVGLLGVLQSGGYYVPLDADYPPERLSFMLQDAAVPVLLTLERLRAVLPAQSLSSGLTVVCLDSDWATLSGCAPEEGSSAATSAGPEDLAYVIYTSGSTGRPKGVMIAHRSVVNYLWWMQQAYPVSVGEGVFAKAPISFDASIWELFLPLVAGARVVLGPAGAHVDPLEIIRALERHAVTVAQFVPSQLQMILESTGAEGARVLGGLRRLFCGGERLPGEVLARFLAAAPQVPVTNLYGPTEATVYATHWDADTAGWNAGDPVLLGSPIANTQVYLLDAQLQLVPQGVAGELCIGGAGVARGYLHRAELTAERFVADPFGAPEGRLYRTGDRARYRSDGTLEYLGRLDTQVKLRGFRVELGEIEAALAAQPEVQSAVVLVREVAGDQQLVAYCIASDDGEKQQPALGTLRERLRRVLPEFMLPAAVAWVTGWPLNANGKLDRAALASLAVGGGNEPEAAYIAPRTPVEETVAALWRAVLRRERLGVDQSFFDLGGHSLLAMRVLVQIASRFGKRLTLREFFEAPTIAAQAAFLSDSATSSLLPVEKIPRRAGAGSAPLSVAQEALWYLQRSTSSAASGTTANGTAASDNGVAGDSAMEGGAYNVRLARRLEGALDVAALQASFAQLIARHGALRTRFRLVDGEPRQSVSEPGPFEFSLVDVSESADAMQTSSTRASGNGVADGFPDARARVSSRADETLRLLTAFGRRPFDLSGEVLLRVLLVRLGADEHLLLLVSHHIVTDGTSLQILLRDLGTYYAAQTTGIPADLPPLALEFADYVAWQREQLQGARLEELLAYWRTQLAGAPALLALPTDHARPLVPRFAGAHEVRVYPRALLDELQALARREGVTLFMLLLAAYATLLHRYARQEDVVLGTPVEGREAPELAGVVGYFINTLPVRVGFADDPRFTELLAQVRERTLGAFEHQAMPSDVLQRELQTGGGGLFQTLLLFTAQSGEAAHLGPVALRPLGFETGSAKFDLTLSLSEGGDGLRASLEYRRDLFEPATVRRMAAHFEVLLEGIAAQPEGRVSALPLLSEEERAELSAGNATQQPLRAEATLPLLIAEQVARTPDAVALEDATTRLTYAQLAAEADSIAQRLRARGVVRGDLVALCADRTVRLVVGLLGILQAGAAYVPLDPEYPAERLAFMLEDSGARVVLADAALFARLPVAAEKLVALESQTSVAASEIAANGVSDAAANDASNVATSDLAYAMYTSGSTGRPKGVLITHEALVNFLQSMAREPGLSAADTLLAVTTLSFDIAGLEVWLPLTVGGRVVLAPRAAVVDGRRLGELLESSQATVLQATPTTWRLLLEAGWTGKADLRMLCGGEALPPDLAAQLLSRGRELWNMYGPTETTIWSSLSRVRAGEPIGLGNPIANTQLHVLEPGGDLAPLGVAGELHIGGAGVAQGYWQRAELTAERFVPDPYAGGAQRMYRTGDLVRRHADGRLEYLGRLDAQVKLRGFRIELGEIEAALAACPGVAQAVATVRDDAAGNGTLIAYVVGERAPADDVLRGALRAQLPAFMLPSRFVRLDALPLTPNGKLDRNALPAPHVSAGRSVVAARTQQEIELLSIFKEVLRCPEAGVEDDFFELGGHSLLAMRIVSRLQELYDVRIPLGSIFEHPTVAQLATLVAEKGRSATAVSREPALVRIPRGALRHTNSVTP